MTIVSANHLSLSFAQHTIFTDVDFSVQEGERVGIIGVNGAGKTSLFRVLTGAYAPDAGQVFLAKGKTIGILEQNPDLSANGQFTMLDYLYSAFPDLLACEQDIVRTEGALRAPGNTEEEIARLSQQLDGLHRRLRDGGGLSFRARCRSMLLRLGFTEDQLERRLSQLSGGQQTKVSLARLLAQEPDLMLFDEPTNHLDMDALSWLEETIASTRKTVLIISHDRYFLDRTTGKTLLLENGRAHLYNGGYTAAKTQRDADAEILDHRYKEQQKVIARIRANIEFQRRCGQEHNFVTIRSKEKQLARMEQVERMAPPPRGIRLSFRAEEESAGEVLRCRGLSFSYGETPLLKNLDFLICKGERVLFLGANGCGKSTLMKLLCGRLVPRSGRVETGHNIRIGYYDQENRDLSAEKTVFDELHDAYPSLTDFEVRSTLALFLFGAEEIEKRVEALSGGERARLTLAKLILRKVNLLIMDEPTNHLDIGSREALETALEEFPGTVIAVSHDRYFIDRLATRIIEINPHAPGGMTDYPLESYENAYEQYLRLKEQHTPAPDESATQKESAGKLQYEERKREAADRRGAERRLRRATARIAELEGRIEEIDRELFGDAATDYMRAAALTEEKSAAEEELLKLYELTL